MKVVGDRRAAGLSVSQSASDLLGLLYVPSANYTLLVVHLHVDLNLKASRCYHAFTSEQQVISTVAEVNN